jgi:hypothetical protein
VIQIYNSLNPELHFDLSKTFSAQRKKINRKLLPAIKAAINPKVNAYDSEIIAVIKKFHKSRRDVWKKKQDGTSDERAKNAHVAARREQVFIILIFSTSKKNENVCNLIIFFLIENQTACEGAPTHDIH